MRSLLQRPNYSWHSLVWLFCAHNSSYMEMTGLHGQVCMLLLLVSFHS
ncbi:hypothetical protein RchiOBHm_Chr5g0056631 [Rosa chinensis]|uniref:Uncharacterized protein n=1 Tax=Rosa chinensis TaxID=74649 RepID=A0A2P6QGP6_ROSCH|nr:hypothetical protein RchiOBHm_Chr5g0056631 [Rosa chinensis]